MTDQKKQSVDMTYDAKRAAFIAFLTWLHSGDDDEKELEELAEHSTTILYYLSGNSPQDPAVPREVLEFINNATKRSNYQWSEGCEYSALDHYNEGKIALAQRIVALLGGKE